MEVPLGTTEDRLLGSVNAEALVEKRRWSGRIGLIEEAHGGVLYIDEINLLPDHLADYILDSAASGRYRMERDGITRSVESRYILVGTMNPDEGDLRPQLSDRFAHGVLIRDDFRHEQRIEIVKRRIAFDDDPEKFVEGFAPSMSELANRVALARRRITRSLFRTINEWQWLQMAGNSNWKASAPNWLLFGLPGARQLSTIAVESKSTIFRRRGASASGIGEQINPALRSRHRPRRRRARLCSGIDRQKRPARRWGHGPIRRS